jgi:membrane protease YdiL (CAAX protease family)
MGALAWFLTLLAEDRRMIFAAALSISALLFGLVHILYPMPVGGSVGVIHAAAVVVKSGGAGLVLGWAFWRWGLPYSNSTE